jgi:hypothetical protein
MSSWSRASRTRTRCGSTTSRRWGSPGLAHGEERDVPLLDGIDEIYVVIEPDAGGEAVLDWLGRSAIRDRVRLIHLSELKEA